MAKGVNLLSSDPIYLKVGIPQPTMEEPELKALPHGSCPSSILITSPVRPPPPKAEGEVSITMEVRELLPQAALDTSEHASGSSTPKRQEPIVLFMPLPTKLEDFPKPVDMSSQVSTPDYAEMDDASLEEMPTLSSLTVEPSGASSDTPPPDVAHLQEVANKAIGDLLVVRSSLDAHWQKLVSEFSMALCENDSEATESIKEAKAICTHSIQEAEDRCSVAIREVEAQMASQAISIQQSHHKAVQHLEEESIEEERKSQLNFLSVCQTALQASPPKFCGTLVASYHVLLGHTPMSHLFSIPHGAPPFPPGSAPGTSSSSVPKHSPRAKQQHHSPDPMDASWLDHVSGNSQGALYLKAVRGNALVQGINKKPLKAPMTTQKSFGP